MSRHVSHNAHVAMVTGGNARVVGSRHMTRYQAEEDAAKCLLTTDLPESKVQL